MATLLTWQDNKVLGGITAYHPTETNSEDELVWYQIDSSHDGSRSTAFVDGDTLGSGLVSRCKVLCETHARKSAEPLAFDAERELRKACPRLFELPEPTAEETRLADEQARREERYREQGRREESLQVFFRSVGSRYMDCTLDNFETLGDAQKAEVVRKLRVYVSNLPTELACGGGVILFGPSGTGKDHLLAALSRIAIEQYGVDVRWRDCLDLFGEVRDRIGDGQSEAELVRRYAEPTILYLSDPVDLTAHQSNVLKQIVDRRYRFMRPTWISLNAADSKEASQSVGAALVDRLRHDALALHCNWPSYRKAKDHAQAVAASERELSERSE